MHALGRVEYEIRDGEVVYADSGPVRVMVTEGHVGAASEPTLRDLSEALIAVYGTDYGIHSPTWISRFTDMTRQAAAYRDGRVLLAGDAAHVHSPDGAQGLQIGVQDAVNLGWKLAQVVNRTSPESLLDTYHAERHPVAARVLRTTMAHVALRRPDERTEALRDTIAELLMADESRRRFAAMMFGLDIHYDLGEGHPLLGRRMPDLDLVTADGPLRVFTLLHDARPVLLNLGEPGGFDITPWADRVQLIDAEYAGAWELPVLGRGHRSHRRADPARRTRGLGRRSRPTRASPTRSPPGSDLTDAIAEVRDAGGPDHAGELELDRRALEVVEQPLAGAEEDRDHVDMHLVDQPGLQVLLDDARPTAQRHVLVAGRRPSLLEGRLDAVGDEVEGGASLLLGRLAGRGGSRRRRARGRAGRLPTSRPRGRPPMGPRRRTCSGP